MTQVARHQGRRVYAFTRAADVASRHFALSLGATWAGPVDDRPDVELDAAILFAPAGELLPLALKAVRKGGTVVCAGIHMSDIPSFPYALLWGERVVRSVANLTRRDGIDFLAVARSMSIVAETTVYGLEDANRALGDLRRGDVQGSAVLRIA
jgi:propanol-preferring alcohol dehydrogenase